MTRERAARTYTLRRASTVVFALISVLPLLLFAYTLHALNQLHQTMAQIGLGSALALSMLGFYIYAVMIARLSDVLREIEVHGTSGSQPAPDAPVVTMAVEPGPGIPPARGHAGTVGRAGSVPTAAGPGPFAPKRRNGGSARAKLVVPGMGRITELTPSDGAALSDLDLMWKAEAEPLLGRRVLVAVRNVADPIKGTLYQVTEDGVILDQSGAKFGISYTRVSAIEADTAPEPV
jgi:hypothetical protein